MTQARASVYDGAPSDLDVAHHETGHALVAVALGYRLHTVTIAPDVSAETLGKVTTLCIGRPDRAQLAADIAHGGREARLRARHAAIGDALFAGAGYAAEALQTQQARVRLPLLLTPVDDLPEGDVRNWNAALYLAAADRWGSAVRGASWCASLLQRYMAARRPLLDDLAALLIRERTVEGEAFRDAVYDSEGRRGVELWAPELLSAWWERRTGGAR